MLRVGCSSKDKNGILELLEGLRSWGGMRGYFGCWQWMLELGKHMNVRH